MERGRKYRQYKFIDKSGRILFGNETIIRYAQSFVNGYALIMLSHDTVEVIGGEEAVYDDYFHNIYIFNKQFQKVAGPFRDTFLFDDDSDYLYVVSKNEHGYLSIKNNWICRSCWGANVSHNRACLYPEEVIVGKAQPCRIINERGKPVAKYSLYGFLLTDKNDFDYLHKKLLVTFDNTAGCLNRLRVVESMIHNQWYRFMYHIKLLHFKITKPSRYDNVITTQNGYILWPPGWNDPCADTDGVIVWPKGACKP